MSIKITSWSGIVRGLDANRAADRRLTLGRLFPASLYSCSVFRLASDFAGFRHPRGNLRTLAWAACGSVDQIYLEIC